MKKIMLLLIMTLLIGGSASSLEEPRMPTPQDGDDETFEITVGEARLALYYKELALYRADLIRTLEPQLRLNTLLLEETEKENRWLKVIAVGVPIVMLSAFLFHEHQEQK